MVRGSAAGVLPILGTQRTIRPDRCMSAVRGRPEVRAGGLGFGF
jgi:hypothetical protein